METGRAVCEAIKRAGAALLHQRMMLFERLILVLVCIVGTLGFTNPIKEPNGSDPFIVYSGGYYYLTSTTWTNLQLTRATTIGGLKTATPKVVWTDSTASRCCNVWAPEIHWMPNENSWYLYYSAGTRGVENQKMHVLKGSSSNLWDSTWSYVGRMIPSGRDTWDIDSTVLVVGSNRYFVYSSYEGGTLGNGKQSLYIAPMTSATALGRPVLLSSPTYSWETVTAAVNEGATPLYQNGRTFLIFSASHCSGTGYKLGQLELTGTDPMNPSHWTKKSTPIFTTANGIYQPGHNAFFTSPSGQTWNVYHADRQSGSACNGSRYTAVQPVSWNSDGTPNLGSPRPLSENIPEPV